MFLHVLEEDLAVVARGGHLGQVNAVVPRVLLCTWGGVHLGLLGSLCKLLQVLDRDLVVCSSALEPFRDLKTLSLSEVFGGLAREARHLLLLGCLCQLLREVPLRSEQGDG